MTYRSLLVVVDNDAACAARVRFAARLARDLDAHLVGLAPTGLVEYPFAPEAAVSLAEFATLAWDALREQSNAALAGFRAACGDAGLKSWEAVLDEADKASSVSRHAHCSDLVILGQADPSASGWSAARDLVEDVVLTSARPTLVLPYAGAPETLDGDAFVAWDDSREAARALSDALPLLRRARRVQVVQWNESDDDDAVLRPRLDALQKWLLWQGVAAEAHLEGTSIDIADAILSRAADFSARFAVMGAYGHSRFAERVLGGATRGLLESMTVPVVMSH